MFYHINNVSFYNLWNSLNVTLPLSPHKTIFKKKKKKEREREKKKKRGKFITYDRATESTTNFAEIHFPK